MSSSKSILTRSIRVIDAVSKNEQGLKFSEVSKVLDNPSPSTVNKILRELVHEEILQKTAEKRYMLGRKVFFWGRVMAAQNTPIQIIRQQMHYLHKKFRLSVNLFTCVDGNLFCLESYLDSDSPLLYPAGKSLPLRLSAQGAVFFIPAEKLDDCAYLKEEAKKNEEFIAVEELRRMIDHAREQGIQDDFGLFYPGTRRFAIPLCENGRTVMTLGVGISATRALNGDHCKEITAELKNVQTAIAIAME